MPRRTKKPLRKFPTKTNFPRCHLTPIRSRPSPSTARRSPTPPPSARSSPRFKDGKAAREVVYTAYTLDGEPNRPVTFAFNGGPGASSVFLNFGAIGPKHLSFGNAGDSPSDPAILTDNPGTWLDFTDLVFIDPIGTGF